ncbi:MAG: patatin-like phospholipase family protein [Alphaproteobacteria bacterium]|nr:patatin-like phospholipase family protein [Alphaproteobacteria bacterium]
MAHAPRTPSNRKLLKPRGDAKPITLALQGGGAHGAFTWGVLDRLCEETGLEFEGISGTSAGSMNAVVFAHGLTVGGRDGAKEAMETFWRRISEAGKTGPIQRTPWETLTKSWNLDHSPAYFFLDTLTRIFSPYQLNPMNVNPLREILGEEVDFERLRRECSVKLFISATNVQSGKNRIFRDDEVDVDAVMASACLPFMFQSVEIDGDAYWDGGYMGNPAIYPLIYDCRTPDVVIVQVNPLTLDTIPKTAAEIFNRLNEINFNSTLMREMRAIAFVTKLIDEGALDGDHYKRMNIHMIGAEEEMKALGVSSKLNADWAFLTHLRDVGRETAEGWLSGNLEKVGVESTVDIQDKFL